MSGLVFELQRDALDKSVAVADLLRKALVVSRKLGIVSIEGWLNSELNGYKTDQESPEYREIVGQVKCFNPYHGWVPLECGDHKLEEKLRTRRITQAIGQLDSLVGSNDGSWLHIPFPPAMASKIKDGMNFPMEPSVHVSPTAVIGILDIVRNQVLEWTLQLEAEDVLGEGMTFTAEEKHTAQAITYNVTNIGEVSNSQLQQGTTNSTQTMTSDKNLVEIRTSLADLRENIGALQLEDSASKQLVADVDTVLSQANSPRPSESIISESLRSIRTVLEGVASNVIANQVLQQMGRWIVGA